MHPGELVQPVCRLEAKTGECSPGLGERDASTQTERLCFLLPFFTILSLRLARSATRAAAVKTVYYAPGTTLGTENTNRDK